MSDVKRVWTAEELRAWRSGGYVSPADATSTDWYIDAWIADACMCNVRRLYKTLKAAQRAVEKWLEKHG